MRAGIRVTSSSFEAKETGAPTLEEILVALSFALDLTEGAVPGHAVRSCLLAVRIAYRLGLDLGTITDLYYASLLKDIGCSSNSARMCQIVGGDDRVVKAAAKLEDWTRPHTYRYATLKLLWDQAAPGTSILRRGAHLLKLGVTQHRNNKELIDLRCDRGAQIVRKLGLGHNVAIAVRHLDEHWDGSGYPSGRREDDIPICSQLMGIAQHLDAFCMGQGPQAALDTLALRSGRWFSPKLVRAVQALDRDRLLWPDCLPNDRIERAQVSLASFQIVRHGQLSAIDIDNICEAFADVVDAKSPFTFHHSLGVLDAAIAIGKGMGLTVPQMELVRRAALLHDLGKLSISNSILDKTSKLTAAEFLQVKRHPGISSQILDRIPAFRQIAVLAGEHHEKLDGSGYPYGLEGGDISLESRVIAVADVYAALAEERPYREALGPAEIKAIMSRDIPRRLDAECYTALCAVMEQITVPKAPVVQCKTERVSPAERESVEVFI
jgi:HD-GYP domain-containing protein (c-di-GMP phosphodiesterase class II)